MFTYVDQNWSNQIFRAPADRNNGPKTGSKLCSDADSSDETSSLRQPCSRLIGKIIRMSVQAYEEEKAMREKQQQKWKQ